MIIIIKYSKYIYDDDIYDIGKLCIAYIHKMQCTTYICIYICKTNLCDWKSDSGYASMAQL